MGVHLRYLLVASFVLCWILVVAAKTVDPYKVSNWENSVLNFFISCLILIPGHLFFVAALASQK